MPLSTIFQLYRGSYWWKKPEYPVKNIKELMNTRFSFGIYK